MKSLFVAFLLSSAVFAVGIGDQAPEFKLEGTPSKAALSDHIGKYVVLEWYNDGCPFVRKHYDSNNMQNLQKKYKGKVSWLTINSSAKGRQGFIKNIGKAKEKYSKEQMAAMSLLIDSDGIVGKAYAAKTTPHMYIIDPKGKLVYQGAIDSISSADSSDIKDATNYVDVALTEALAGRKVAMAKTQPYGCSVKY
jgi:peroxiredoxin